MTNPLVIFKTIIQTEDAELMRKMKSGILMKNYEKRWKVKIPNLVILEEDIYFLNKFNLILN